jgi:aldehyde dehydrogenase (NAD+)
VVLKPASAAPLSAWRIVEALHQAGIPKGVVNFVAGSGGELGGALVNAAGLKAISFTGSCEIGDWLHAAASKHRLRIQLEMGGKNPTIVLADADLDLAARLVAIAGFGLTGQACTATSRVIIEKSVAEAFTQKLIEKAKAIVVGNGLKPGVTMGPAVNEQEFKGNFDYVDIAKNEGGTVAYGGARLSDGELAHGFFMQPTIITGVTPSMRIAREEVFGPVIAIIAVENFDEAIAVANGVDVGLSASIVTRDLKKAMLYSERIQAGVVKINQISTGLALQAPFGGVKKSSTDSFKEQGAGAIDFYTRIKTVYLDYSA